MAIIIPRSSVGKSTATLDEKNKSTIKWFSGRKQLPNATIRIRVSLPHQNMANGEKEVFENKHRMDTTLENSSQPIKSTKTFEENWKFHTSMLPDGVILQCFVMTVGRDGKFARAAIVNIKVNHNAKKQTVLWRASFNHRCKVIEGSFDVMSIHSSGRYNFLSIQNLREMEAISSDMARVFCKKEVLEVHPFIPNDEVWEPFEIYKGKYKGAKKFGVHLTKEKSPKAVVVKTYEPSRLLDV